MITVNRWSGREVRALREAKRMSVRAFADHLGISDRMVSKWEAGGEQIIPRPVNQEALDTSLSMSAKDVQERFSAALRPSSDTQASIDVSGGEPHRSEGVTMADRPRYCRCGTRLSRDNRSDLCSVCQRHVPELRLTAPDFPADFWHTPKMHEAFQSRNIGNVIYAYRTHPYHGRELSQQVISEWVGVSQAQVSRAELGPPVRNLDKLIHWANSLHIPRELLWFEVENQDTREGVAVHPPENGTSDIFTPDDEERLILAARSPRRNDPGVIEVLSTILASQRRAEDLVGSASVIKPVTAQLATVTELVTEARGKLRASVLDIGSQWAQFSGWLHASTGQLSEANRLYGIALEWATEADKPNMIATALNMQGHTAWSGGKVGPMIGLSDAAQRDRRISPGIRALAVQQAARGRALAGESGLDEINRSLDEATDLVTLATTKIENEPPWIYFFSPDYLILQRGLAYRLSGHYVEASQLLSAGLAAISPDMRKTEWVASHYILQLALTHIKSGDITEACKLLGEANIVAGQTDSARLKQSLVRFHHQLNQKWSSHPGFIELTEAMRNIPR